MNAHEEVKQDLETSEHESSESSSSESTEDTNSSNSRRTPSVQRGSVSRSPHPPGFKEVSSRVEKFSGKRAEDGTFEVWLDDFEEATTDCGWTDNMKARWFSWFVSGPARLHGREPLLLDRKKNGRVL